MRTTKDVIATLAKPRMEGRGHPMQELSAPPYTGGDGKNKIALHIESMSRHTADAGHQLFAGLCHNGYTLCGKDLEVDEIDVEKILDLTNPSVVIVNDKREWDGRRAGYRDGSESFRFIEALKDRHDIFKITVLKDAHQRPSYHRTSAEEMGIHAWITYYHPTIIAHVAPYVRKEHLIRTSHSIDSDAFGKFRKDRNNCLISGAVSNHYPLRQRLIHHFRALEVAYQSHPGYGAQGLKTPKYLAKLGKYKTAICTSSMWGFALRKHIEATCAGCKVITNLPIDDVMEEIDGNLTRVDDNIPIEDLRDLIKEMGKSWDLEEQKEIAERARAHYDYRAVTKRLTQDIEKMRLSYEAK